MSPRRLLRQAGEMWEVPRDLLLRRYPPFVTGDTLPRGHVPVFVFHGVEPAAFERKLLHLHRNHYVTLGVDEYFHVLMGSRPAPERACLLTFDDGRASVWGVGAPLLRRFGMRGVVFLVPGRTGPEPPGPTWDDVRAGRVPGEEVLERDRGPRGLVSWPEVEALAREGLLEFASHTLTHARVHTAPRVAGFMTPAQRNGYAPMDVPWVQEGGRELLAGDVPLGTPLLLSAPRTSEAVRFVEDPALRRACVERVADGGGAEFFRRPRWHSELRRLLPRVTGRLETPAEREDSIRRELAEARRLIAEHTGRAPVHLCYPWHASGPTARRLAVEAGYRTAFCGKVADTPITLSGGDPLSIARIGEDYVELLPGEGRLELREVLLRKWHRRLGRRAGAPS